MASRELIRRAFSQSIKKNVAERIMTRSQGRDVQKQFRLFEAHLPRMRRRFPGRFVAFAGGEQYAGVCLGEIISQVDRVVPTPLFYAEEIPTK